MMLKSTSLCRIKTASFVLELYLYENSTWICSEVHWSRLTDLTLDMCTPRFLWMPAHLMQINTPRFQEAHLGPDNARKTDCDLNMDMKHKTCTQKKHKYASCSHFKVRKASSAIFSDELT